MSTYRITYREPYISAMAGGFVDGSTLIQKDKPFMSPGRIEIRSSTGDVSVYEKTHDSLYRIRKKAYSQWSKERCLQWWQRLG